MTAGDWAFYIGIRALEWLNPIVHVIGLGVCVWACRLCRKPGYLLVAIYFLLATGGLVFGDAIRRTLVNRSQAESELSAEAQKRYAEEFMALRQKYYPAPQVARRSVSFPLGPVILVSGLWVLARRDSKSIPEQGAAAHSALPDHPA